MATDTTREALAAVAHDVWAIWMTDVLRISTENADGSITIPAGVVEQWKRQIATPYHDLPDDERASARTVADRMLTIIGRT